MGFQFCVKIKINENKFLGIPLKRLKYDTK
jgi:hypothetical protein